MKYYFGPMEGITNRVYRQTHRKYFPGPAKYYAPFLSPTRDFRFTPRLLQELLPELSEAVPLVPQLLVNSAEQFSPAAAELAALGFREVNLNLGCPSRTVTAKRKGAGLLRDPEALDRLLDEIFNRAGGLEISVKTRMGLNSPEEFDALLTVFNRYPIHELTVHARVQADYYSRPADPAALGRRASEIHAPLCYSGDVFTPEDASRIRELLPQAEAIMLARGLAAEPALAGMLQGTPPPPLSVYRAFHDELVEGYRAAGWDRRAILCHMKEIWALMGARFRMDSRLQKRLRKAATPEEYRDTVNAIFAGAAP